MWRHLLTKFARYKVPLVMVSTPGQFYPVQFLFYTSTASAASDKYDLWPRPRPSSLLLVIYQNFPGLLGMVEGGMYQVCAEYSRPRAQPQVTEAPV